MKQPKNICAMRSKAVFHRSFKETGFQRFISRYKKNLGEESRPLETKIVDATNSTELQFAAGVAAYGMILRDSEYKGESTFTMAKELVQKGLSFDPNGYRKSLVDIIGKAEKIK